MPPTGDRAELYPHHHSNSSATEATATEGRGAGPCIERRARGNRVSSRAQGSREPHPAGPKEQFPWACGPPKAMKTPTLVVPAPTQSGQAPAGAQAGGFQLVRD